MTGGLFTSSRIRLCAPRLEDSKQVAAWHEDDAYLRNVDTEPAYPLSESRAAAAITPVEGGFYFHLRTREEDRLIGFATLHSIEWNNQSATLAIGLGNAQDRGKGYGDEGLKLLLHYAFMELNLYRLGLEVIAYNRRAQDLYTRNGFQIEGVIRQAVYRDNQRFDRVAMGILRPEWLKNNALS
ncbi:GNAT family N-acetyltransferase [Pseudomonas cerasi]